MNKKNNIIILIIIFIGLLLIGTGVFFTFSSSNKDNKESNNNNKKENETNDVNKEVNQFDKDDGKLDFDYMKSDINNLTKDESKGIYLVKCESMSVNEDTITSFEYEELSDDAINSIIDMLKKADSYESKIVISLSGCPAKDVGIIIGSANVYGDIRLILNYSEAGNTLLLGYGPRGYAFKYNDASVIENFIENLK